MDKIKITYPNPIKAFTVWYAYILQGFRDIGAEVVHSPEMNEVFENTKQRGVLPFNLELDDRQVRIWYDNSDFVQHYYKNVYRQSDFYFKIQYKPEFGQYENFFPIGQTGGSTQFPDRVEGLRKVKDKKNYQFDIIHVARATGYKIRIRAAEIIKAQAKWKSIMGVAPHPKRPAVPRAVLKSKYGYYQHLELQAQTKVCLAFAGVGGDWTWRHNEILGMGSFLLMPETELVLPGNPSIKLSSGGYIFGSPHSCWQEMKPDLSDMVGIVDYYLTHDEEREQIAARGRVYWDKFLSAKAQAEYVVSVVRGNS